MNSEKPSPYKTTTATTTTTTTTCDPSSSGSNSNNGCSRNLSGANANIGHGHGHGLGHGGRTMIAQQAAHHNQGDETAEVDAETKIDLHEFLDFLNVSCHVNELISGNQRNPNERNGGGGGGSGGGGSLTTVSKSAGASKQKSNINFQKLAENRLVNELYAHKSVTASSNTAADEALNDHHQHQQHVAAYAMGVGVQRCRSNGGSVGSGGTASSNVIRKSVESTPMTAKSTVGLHPKLSEKLDFVINEGILDSVLPFVCPVQASNPPMTGARTKLKPKEQPNIRREAGGHEVTDIANESEKDAAAGGGGGGAGGAAGDTNTAASGGVNAGSNGSGGMVKFKDHRSFNRNIKMHGQQNLASVDEKREPEVIIHVCDEVKNTSRDFSCPQNLLVSKMGYFADVTAGQKLDDMDISVHCDIHIFDWLMRWVKHSANGNDVTQHVASCASVGAVTAGGGSGVVGGTGVSGAFGCTFETGPQLDASNVVPILVSASFLQMEPLFADCLSFCHARLSEVVRMSTNLSCLNDSIMTRLAAMFTNSELEMVRDKKERVTPRLWTKLIQSLCEPEPEALRGHFYSLAGLFRCARCEKCLTNTVKSYISCLPSNVRLNRWGQLVSHHVRDSNWDINTYITQLFKEQKSWRKVYWKLWGHCHFLYCCSCETHFPVYQLAWCRYHPEGPNFLGPVSEGRIAGPTGRYPCCGQQAFRFETMSGANGCQFREHSVLVETDRERAIFAIVQLVFENHALCEPPPLKLQEAVANSADAEPRWTGLSLMPQRCRQGLLPILNPDESTARIAKRARRGLHSNYFVESTSESESSDTFDDAPAQQSTTRRRYLGKAACTASFSTSSDGCESDFSDIKAIQTKKGPRKRQTETPGRHWSGELSARSNQDHQREFEEKVMKQVAAIVSKKIGAEHAATQNSIPLGGTYVKLEAEWKEQVKQRTNNQNQSNANLFGGNSSNQIPTLSSSSTTGAASANVKPKTK